MAAALGMAEPACWRESVRVVEELARRTGGKLTRYGELSARLREVFFHRGAFLGAEEVAEPLREARLLVEELERRVARLG